jgi:hypothetical protein
VAEPPRVPARRRGGQINQRRTGVARRRPGAWCRGARVGRDCRPAAITARTGAGTRLARGVLADCAAVVCGQDMAAAMGIGGKEPAGACHVWVNGGRPAANGRAPPLP